MKTILITGASTGIGLATARQLLEEGHFVILTARKESLYRFTSADFLKKYPKHWVRPLDVRDSMERTTLINQIEKDLGRLDVLINNAAVIYRAPIEFAYDFEFQEQMLVNFHAPLALIKSSLPLLRASPHGHIINISSAAGFLSVPTMGLYSASKHALEAASEALFLELAPWNIKVTIVEPGFIASDAYQTVRLGLTMNRSMNPCALHYAKQLNTITAFIERASKISQVSPTHAAYKIAHLIKMKNPPLHMTITVDARAIMFLKRILPSRMFTGVIHICLAMIQRGISRLNPPLVARSGPKQSSAQ